MISALGHNFFLKYADSFDGSEISFFEHIVLAMMIMMMMMMMMMMVMMNYFCGMVDEGHLALFSAGTIVRDPHHRESPIHREKDLNLQRT